MSETNNNLPNLSTLQENNEKVLNDIKQLQQQEQDLFSSLQDKISSNSITSEQQQKITNKISELYQMRLNLYALLKDNFSFYENDASSSANTLKEQKYAIDIIEKQLEIERVKLAKLEETKYNKLREIEFNSSYAAQYQAQTDILKLIAFWCVPLIIIILLSNQGLIPSGLANLLIALVILIGGAIILRKIIDSLNRDNMNYNEYNWNFNPNNVDTDTTSKAIDPWERQKLNATCIGAMCCSDNQTFDDEQNKCIDNTQEAFVSNNLSKYAMNPNIDSKQSNIYVNDKIESFNVKTDNYVSI